MTNGVTFDNSGKRVGTSDMIGSPFYQQRIVDALTAQLGKQVESVETITCPVNEGETLTGWNNAIIIT